MWLRLCINVHIYIHTFLYICIPIYICKCVYMYVCPFTTSVSPYVCVHIRTLHACRSHICMCLRLCLCVFLCIGLSRHMCAHICAMHVPMRLYPCRYVCWCILSVMLVCAVSLGGETLLWRRALTLTPGPRDYPDIRCWAPIGDIASGAPQCAIWCGRRRSTRLNVLCLRLVNL